jgi:hypothetical protein
VLRAAGETNPPPPKRKIFKIVLSWMKKTLDFSFWQRKKLLQKYFFYLFSSALSISLNFSIY